MNLLVISERLNRSIRGAEMLITQSASVQQWQRARLRVRLWVLELNSMDKHPASLTHCLFEPSERHQSFLKQRIIFKRTPQSNCVQLRPQTVTLGKGVQLEQCLPHFVSISLLQCFRVCCNFPVLFLLSNKVLLCFADFNPEAARENTLPYSAWKCREGGPESVCPRGKLI